MTEHEAQLTAAAIKGTLIACIDYNLGRPKPHHLNKPIMTALLQMEQAHG